ncbi:hypothetical protein C1645_793382, partial [Glomus cerebriforme]
RNHGFEKFIGLYRNKKYSSTIDWQSTFFSLNDKKNTMETSFYTISLIQKFSTVKDFSNRLLLHDHLWDVQPDPDHMNFIDIIKDINEKIWKPCRNQFILDEFNAGMDRKSKLKKKLNNSHLLLNTNPFNINITLDDLHNFIVFGSDWLQYYSHFC